MSATSNAGFARNALTLRDYFAVHATDADLGKYLAIYQTVDRVVTNPNGTKAVVKDPVYISREEARYRYADEMLKARAR